MSKIKTQNHNANLKAEKSSKALKQQIEDLKGKWKRAAADYSNLEKRTVKQKEEWVKFANQTLLLSLLEIVDDLERAIEHTKDSGLQLILDKFSRVMQEQGVEEVEVKGQFDPKLMECTEQVSGKKNQVVSVDQKGYLYHDRLLRPAKVKVGKGGI